MGASVYAFIEYREYEDFWSSFGEINLPRDVEFLCAIAWGDGGDVSELPHPPRDEFPANASFEAQDSFFVSEDEISEFLEVSNYDDSKISVKEYASRMGAWAVKEYEASGLLPQPELTNFGWLNLPELKANLVQRGISQESLLPPTRAVLVAMTELAVAYGRDSVRLVFWISM
jgi:hypothetical protein